MIVLLPNVEKQSQLYSVFEKLSRKPSTKIVKCEVCKQYLLKDEISYHKTLNHPKETTIKNKVQQKNEDNEEFPSLAASFATKINLPTSNNPSVSKTEAKKDEFPPLGNGLVSNAENRFSTMPTANLFSNPSSHLSLANKKKHRLQK